MPIENLIFEYFQLINEFAGGVEKDYDLQIYNLFSPNLKKINNGIESVTSRANFMLYLNYIKGLVGLWTHQTNLIIPSADNKFCTVKGIAITEKVGVFDIISIFTVSSNNQIQLIIQNYYILSLAPVVEPMKPTI